MGSEPNDYLSRILRGFAEVEWGPAVINPHFSVAAPVGAEEVGKVGEMQAEIEAFLAESVSNFAALLRSIADESEAFIQRAVDRKERGE